MPFVILIVSCTIWLGWFIEGNWNTYWTVRMLHPKRQIWAASLSLTLWYQNSGKRNGSHRKCEHGYLTRTHNHIQCQYANEWANYLNGEYEISISFFIACILFVICSMYSLLITNSKYKLLLLVYYYFALVHWFISAHPRFFSEQENP